jgi:hypothetical protein
MIQRNFWIRWITLSAIGWMLGFCLIPLIDFSLIRLLKYLIILTISDWNLSALDEVMNDNIGDGIPSHFIGIQSALIFGLIFGFLRGAVFGSIGGFTQSLILKRYLPPPLWILASSIAWACIWGVIEARAWAWGWTGAILLIQGIYGLLGAVIVGVFEWLVLQKHISKAYWWILATIATWFVSSIFVLEISQKSWTTPYIVYWILVGTGHGVITGKVLDLLLKSAKNQNSYSPDS